MGRQAIQEGNAEVVELLSNSAQETTFNNVRCYLSAYDISLNEDTGELAITTKGGDQLVVGTNENDIVINDRDGGGFVDDIAITDQYRNAARFDFDNETGDVTRTDNNGDGVPDDFDDRRESLTYVLDEDTDGDSFY